MVFNEAMFPYPQFFAEPAGTSSFTPQPNILAVLPQTPTPAVTMAPPPLTADTTSEAPSSSPFYLYVNSLISGLELWHFVLC